MGINHNKLVIQERREKIWTLTTKGKKGYEIAKELGVGVATVSRDINYLVAQSRNYLNDLARSTLPFMYQASIEGIRSVMKECWNIYQSEDESINWFQKLAALKLAKECHEAQFKLLSDAPSILYLRTLEDKLTQIEKNRQIH
jgi:hypothetical protein